MKVLVTGGSGFIGSKLVTALINIGYKVRLLSRDNVKPIESEHIEIVQCDLTDNAFNLVDAVNGCSVVFNCVGELHDESLMQVLHVDATARLVSACKQVAKSSHVSIHFVQLSSVGAYGPGSPRPNSERVVTEETVPAPVGRYEITKTEADDIIVSAVESGVFSYTILRPSIVYGASMPNDSIRQWGRMIEKKLFFYIGKRGAIATYVHVDDVVDALLLCGFNDNAKNNIFNISKDCAQEELVNAIAKACDTNAPKIRLPEGIIRFLVTIFSGLRVFPLSHSRVDALIARTTYSTDKLLNILAFQPKRDVKGTIGEVFVKNLKQ